jgi:hypothetical protein
MKTTILFFALSISNVITAQVWTGANTVVQTTRTGDVSIGPTTTPYPTETKFFIRNNLNQKVSLAVESEHTQDFQFGISAVNRANTKAFSVLLKNGTSYSDAFVVFGDGKVRATEIRVKSPIFPDYVFDDKYYLMPLDELSKYIKTNKHLPNIPSENEVIKDGLQVGEMQVKQMEKIEELTLYILQLKNEIDSMKKEINLLRGNNK